jgi:RNA recognition motif-containing protein
MASLFSFAKDADAPPVLADIFSDSTKKKFEKVVVPLTEDVAPRKRSKVEEEPEVQKKQRKPKKPKVEETEDQSEIGNEVFVGNLPLTTKKGDVEKLFKEMGTVKRSEMFGLLMCFFYFVICCICVSLS